MKLSPQLATVLSSSPKAGASSMRGATAFAPAMEELMASLSSETPVLPMTQGTAGGHGNAIGRGQIVMPHSASFDFAGEIQPKAPVAVGSGTSVAVARGATGTTIPEPSTQGPMLPEENLEHELPVPVVQAPAVQKTSLEPSHAVAQKGDGVSSTGGPTRERHKTDKTRPGDASNVASPVLADMFVPSLQIPAQSIVVTVPRPQTLAAQIGISKSNVQAASGGVDRVSKRRPDAVVTLPGPTNYKAAASMGKELAKAVPDMPAVEGIAMPAGERRPAPVHEKPAAGQPAQSGQDISSAIGVRRPEGREATSLQSDQQTLKESAKETLTAAQPVVAEKAATHASPAAAPMEHQSAPNIPGPAVVAQRMPPLVEAHRVEANAAQVLQKMDTASSAGAVQLRADARHLDVGVSSGSLGWVEVRASVNPSGRVDAALHVETNASAHVVAAQSKEIADYAREHSVQLGQISVGVGTGDGSRGSSGSMGEPARNSHTAPVRRTVKDPIDSEMRPLADTVSLISIRA